MLRVNVGRHDGGDFATAKYNRLRLDKLHTNTLRSGAAASDAAAPAVPAREKEKNFLKIFCNKVRFASYIHRGSFAKRTRDLSRQLLQELKRGPGATPRQGRFCGAKSNLLHFIKKVFVFWMHLS